MGMFDKEQFAAAWTHYIENATIMDITSPNYGRLVNDVIKEDPNRLEEHCSQRLADYLLDVANGVSIPDLHSKYKVFRHHTKDLEEKGCFFVDSIPPLAIK